MTIARARASVTEIPDYIERRIREPIPPGLCVIPGSTPVVAFGDARVAKVATLGLNPSHLEFRDRGGQELVGCFRRLATHQSLGVSDLKDASVTTIAQVLDDCNAYFQRNPYEWFNQLEPILNACGVSYCNGSACHLDLVQWATKPTWGDLCPTVRSSLIDADAQFLKEQLSNENIELLLVNGKDATKQLLRVFCTSLGELSRIELSGKQTRLFDGFILGESVRVIAWSAYVQSRFIKIELKTAIEARVAQLCQES